MTIQWTSQHVRMRGKQCTHTSTFFTLRLSLVNRHQSGKTDEPTLNIDRKPDRTSLYIWT
jgi:hypothetical protein